MPVGCEDGGQQLGVDGGGARFGQESEPGPYSVPSRFTRPLIAEFGRENSPIRSEDHAKVTVGTFFENRQKAPKSDCNFRVFGHQPKGLSKKLFKNGSGTAGTFVGAPPQNRPQFCIILPFRVLRHLPVTG